MNKIFSLLAAALVLSACSDNSTPYQQSSHDDHDHHDHPPARLFITDLESPRIWLFDVEHHDFINWQANANQSASEILVSQDGLHLAVIGTHNLQRLSGNWHHNHWDTPSLSGNQVSDKVIATVGGFSFIEQGAAFYWANSAASATLLSEITDVQFYPPIFLEQDDHHQSLLQFSNQQASLWHVEDGVSTAALDEAGDPISFSCENVKQQLPTEHGLLLDCAAGNVYSLHFHDEELHVESIDFTGLANGKTAFNWFKQHDDIYGFDREELIKIDHEHTESFASSIVFSGDICTAGAVGTHGDIYVFTSTADLYILEADGSLHQQLRLDETNSLTSSCESLLLAQIDHKWFIIDKPAAMMYWIDQHEGNAHIHNRITLPASLQAASIGLLAPIDADHDDSHHHH